jgi:hypothetical protein
MLLGYMRVSKADGSQVLDLQRDALLAAGVAAGDLYEGSRHRTGAGITLSGTEREHQAAPARACRPPRSGRKPSGPRLPPAPQR